MKKVGVIIGVILVGFGGLLWWSYQEKQATSPNYAEIDENRIIGAERFNGGIADHVKGSTEAAVLLFEYADFQCPGCATVNVRLNRLVEEYQSKLAVVYRNFLIKDHLNSTAMTTAAEAAGLQGFWKPYADLVFANQSSWEYVSGKERTELLVKYFERVSEGRGDVEKFKRDLSSPEIKLKIEFDMGLARKVKATHTPTLILNGENLDFSQVSGEEGFLKLLREKIDRILAEKTK
ncbi:MAG: thioredoxin domain-containing protein [Candidatus Saccharibacteria bacterium]|nr:thioredoxin domain-containing protein [Candidatus Saccharibacteria bacterium]